MRYSDLESYFLRGLSWCVGRSSIHERQYLRSAQPILSSGLPALDKILPDNGIWAGQMISVIGGPDAGKTTLAMHIVAHAQKQGLTCAWIDVGCMAGHFLWRQSGVDTFHLLYQQCCFFDVLKSFVDYLIKHTPLDLLVIDDWSFAVLSNTLHSSLFSAALNNDKFYQDRHRLLMYWIEQLMLFSKRMLVVHHWYQEQKTMAHLNCLDAINIYLHSTGALFQNGLVVGIQSQVQVEYLAKTSLNTNIEMIFS